MFALTSIDEFAAARGLAVALGIGLIIGIERERRQAQQPGRGFAGIRTFALVAITGGLATAIGGTALVVAGAVVVGALTVTSYAISGRRDSGVTTEVALLATFLLGALAEEAPALASGAGVVIAVLLALREDIHHFVLDVMSEAELRDLLLLAAAAVVVLPLLPDEGTGPYGAINPFAIWRLVVLVMAIGGTGYVSLRLLGPRLGLPVAGLAGGFVSSAATIGSLGAVARRAPGLRAPAVSGAVLSTVATILQMVVVLFVTSRETLREFWPALAAAGVTAVVAGLLAALRVRNGREDGERATPGRAFDLRGALLFGGTIAVVLVVSAALNDALGTRGVLVGAAVAGFADTHAAAISVASLVARGELEAGDAVLPILAGLTTNGLTKCVLAYSTGRVRFALPVWAGIAAVIGASWLGGLAAFLVER